MTTQQAISNYQVSYVAQAPLLAAETRSRIIKGLWNIWNYNEDFTQEEFAEMMGGVMSLYGISFEKTAISGMPDHYDDDIDRWFFDEINNEAITYDRFRDLCNICLNFSKSHN